MRNLIKTVSGALKHAGDRGRRELLQISERQPERPRDLAVDDEPPAGRIRRFGRRVVAREERVVGSEVRVESIGRGLDARVGRFAHLQPRKEQADRGDRVRHVSALPYGRSSRVASRSGRRPRARRPGSRHFRSNGVYFFAAIG